jgi:glycosyltransferase involved in cell wall biosynthesis
MDNITVIIVNYNTAKLTKQCYDSLRSFYPNISTILVDNNSTDNSIEWMNKQSNINTTVLLNTKNVGHGPAMHQAILLATTHYVFTLDSDTKILQAGLLEAMLSEFNKQENLYAIGWKRYVNCDGVSGDPKQNKNLTPYIHPYAMLFEKAKYLTLPQFEDSGAPCRSNMYAAFIAGYTLSDFNLKPYIKHYIAGTRRMYNGYWHPKETDKPGEWRENASYPI